MVFIAGSCVSLTRSRAYLKIANLPINVSQWNEFHGAVCTCAFQSVKDRVSIDASQHHLTIHLFKIFQILFLVWGHICPCFTAYAYVGFDLSKYQTIMNKLKWQSPQTHTKSESMRQLIAVIHNSNEKQILLFMKIVMHDIAINCSFTIFIFSHANNNEWNSFSS